MNAVLIVYATVDGHTKKISFSLARSFQTFGFTTQVVSVEKLTGADIQAASHIIIGASIRYGRHHKLVYELIEKYRKALVQKNAAFFSVNLVARKPEKRDPYTNPYTKKFLQEVHWRPACAAVFAGRLNYRIYSFWDKHMIRFIMWITHGPTDPTTDIEFTDWPQVEAFAQTVAQLNKNS
ncbi:menaquinone-dependent protoporphyrinogen oxidase [Alteromonadaceae bacterium 2753L.S.0a.02]|nr:menaquinone-dependent protoporphyrinogen oxidase [Alteromonadaceae bacterium 2753L.S.0a.02]